MGVTIIQTFLLRKYFLMKFGFTFLFFAHFLVDLGLTLNFPVSINSIILLTKVCASSGS